jgi:hypothetical protein
MRSYTVTLDFDVPDTWTGARLMAWIGAAIYQHSRGKVEIPRGAEIAECRWLRICGGCGIRCGEIDVAEQGS